MHVNMSTRISIESFLNKGGDLMNWKDIIISSVKWALSVSIMIFSGIMALYGTLSITEGVFRGIISYIVLGLLLLIAGLTTVCFMDILSERRIDSSMDDENKDIEA